MALFKLPLLVESVQTVMRQGHQGWDFSLGSQHAGTQSDLLLLEVEAYCTNGGCAARVVSSLKWQEGMPVIERSIGLFAAKQSWKATSPVRNLVPISWLSRDSLTQVRSKHS